MRSRHAALVVSATSLSLWSACTTILDIDKDYTLDTDASGSGTSSRAGGFGSSGAGGAGSTATGTGGGFTPPPVCEFVCSSDLRSIVDCYGVVVQNGACTADQGCSPASFTPTCIDNPCQAAKDSRSSIGCDYWALKTGLQASAKGACFAAFVANTWPKPVHIQVDYKGLKLPIADHAWIPKGLGSNLTYEKYDETKGLDVGQVAILFLSRQSSGGAAVPDCPKPAAIFAESGVPGTGLGDAFHITTDWPVVAYQILPYGGGNTSITSATLLLPTSSWGTNYIGINAYPSSPIDVDGVPLMNILANEDNTEVLILPKVEIKPGTGVEGSPAGTVKKYSLKAGQFLQIAQPEELTGSLIASMKPIGVWGGSTCMYVPSDKNDCDSAQQQIPPINALGNEYVAVRHRNRTSVEESPPWRLVGAVDNTDLVWSPALPEGAPEKINQGEVSEFHAPGPFIVSSKENQDKIKPPFYLGGYMMGGQDFGGIGDPEWVNVVPSEQYLSSYVFFADPTYPETSLVVVRTPSKIENEDGEFPFADVNIDCIAEPITGWMPIGKYEYAIVDLVTGNFEGVGNCSSGLRTMSSSLPFGVTVWGWGAIQGSLNVSYAYPAGAGVQPINPFVVTIPPN